MARHNARMLRTPAIGVVVMAAVMIVGPQGFAASPKTYPLRITIAGNAFVGASGVFGDGLGSYVDTENSVTSKMQSATFSYTQSLFTNPLNGTGPRRLVVNFPTFDYAGQANGSLAGQQVFLDVYALIRATGGNALDANITALRYGASATRSFDITWPRSYKTIASYELDWYPSSAKAGTVAVKCVDPAAVGTVACRIWDVSPVGFARLRKIVGSNFSGWIYDKQVTYYDLPFTMTVQQCGALGATSCQW